jgi:hypothetical protein
VLDYVVQPPTGIITLTRSRFRLQPRCTFGETRSRSGSRAIVIVSLAYGRSWCTIWVTTYGFNNPVLAEDSVGRGCCAGLGATFDDSRGRVRRPENYLSLVHLIFF